MTMISAQEYFNARILIVDDQRSMVFVLEKILKESGYVCVSSTTDPLTVCELHRKNRYDLILLDLEMPGMSGFQVMEGLKEIEADDYLPVLVLTSQADYKLRALAVGAKDFVIKPFDHNEILTRIHNMLEVRLLYKKLEDYNKALEQLVQKRAAELRETEALLHRNQTLMQNSMDGILVMDKLGNIVEANDSFCRMLGYTQEEMACLNVADWDAQWSAEELRERFKEHFTQNTRFETVHRRKDGSLINVEISIAGIEIDGQRLIFATSRDISERIAAEGVLRAGLDDAVLLAQQRKDFLAHMSHELRTPLNAILGYAQMLQRDNAMGERNAVGLNVILKSGEHLQELIEDTLDLASLDAGRIKLVNTHIPLANFISGVDEFVTIKAREKELEFICELTPGLPESIFGDVRRLRQILLNLLSNAIKFTDHGRVVLRVSRVSPSRLAFSVKDTGIGIAKNEQEKIFDCFEQLGDAHRRVGGTGLGLAISQQLARLMGENIEVESRINAGSTFRFEVDIGSDASLPQLEWSANQQGDGAMAAGELAEPLIAPPTGEMHTLHRLAQLGNMRNIVQYAERISAIDTRYNPFAARLRRLAEGYQSKAILTFVEQHLHDSSN
jgi:PAS domain S-box-containing protein